MTKKYSDDLKLKVVEEYQEGNLGIRPLAKKYGVKSKSVVDRWIKVYERFGAEGLRSKKHNESDSVQFKLDVLSYMKRTGSSETDTALHFGLTQPITISDMYEIISFLSILLVKCIEGAMERETINGDKHTWLDGRSIKRVRAYNDKYLFFKESDGCSLRDGRISRVRGDSPFKCA